LISCIQASLASSPSHARATSAPAASPSAIAA
jgi:hypothetical protein